MRVLVSLLLLAVAVPAAAQDPVAPPAQPEQARTVEVDRIVAVVGEHPILFSEVLEQINYARAQGMQIPRDSLGQIELARQVLGRLVDEEVLVAVSKDYKIEVTEADVLRIVEQYMDRVRAQFQTDEQFIQALQREGFGSPEALRRQTLERAKRDELQARARDSLRANGRLAPINVTEAEVRAAFERIQRELPPRPASVGFRQIVVAPRAREESKRVARARIDSLRVMLERGADFDSMARAVSADSSSAVQGGDLGWARRGFMVPEFEAMMFALNPGRISPIVETVYGYHIIRVDRVRSAEVRARHILIKPKVDSLDGAVARARADTALALWRQGVSYDSLLKRFHDPDEERTVPEYPRDSLPAPYRTALEGVAEGAFTPIFELPNPATGVPKAVVLQLISSKPAGQYTLEDYQERLRQQLREEKSLRRTLDNLRREYYVSLRL